MSGVGALQKVTQKALENCPWYGQRSAVRTPKGDLNSATTIRHVWHKGHADDRLPCTPGVMGADAYLAVVEPDRRIAEFRREGVTRIRPSVRQGRQPFVDRSVEEHHIERLPADHLITNVVGRCNRLASCLLDTRIIQDRRLIPARPVLKGQPKGDQNDGPHGEHHREQPPK